MKKIIASTVIALSVLSTPALAGGRNGLRVDVDVATGRGGLIGSLLGGGRAGGLDIDVDVRTGRGGLLGALLGGSGHRGGHGHGGCGCR